MSVVTIERSLLNVIGMSIETRPLSPEIPSLWPKFVARIDEIANTDEPEVSYGVMRHQGNALHYMAGVSVSRLGSVPAGMESQVIPAGTYATFRYPLSGLANGFREIFEELLPGSDVAQIEGAPFFERYDQDFDPANPDSLVEICIPVSRRP